MERDGALSIAKGEDNEQAFQPPSRVHTGEGKVRRVGFELEFSGVGLEQASEAVQQALGCDIVSTTQASHRLRSESLGDFLVELDWQFLKDRADQAKGYPGAEKILEPITHTAAGLVPIEVVCPPIPLDRLRELNPLVAALRATGAVGTEESLIAAYGVHINPELPALDAPTILAYLRAFALLQWWLVEAHAVDIARRISPYVDLYPQTYLTRVLSLSDCSLDDIFDDYLTHNPTRNRALDLLPLLSTLDEDRVRAAVDDPRIKARPTFHYRLPNCHIERADWSLADSWNTWCVVERLAARPREMDVLAEDFMSRDRPLLGVERGAWVSHMDQWLIDHALR